MKQLIFFLLALFLFCTTAVAQSSYHFLLEDVQDRKNYEGIYESLPENQSIYELSRVNLLAANKSDSKNFSKLRDTYLTTIHQVLNENNLSETLTFYRKNYQFVEQQKNRYTFEYQTKDNVYIELIDIYYSNKLFEKAVIRQFNPRANKKTKLFVIQFYEYN